MPEILIAKKQYDPNELRREVERELRLGIKLKEAMEDRREIEAAHEAALHRDAKTIEGLGKHVFEMPQWEFHNLVNKYGYDEVHSKDFLRYNQKAFPHLATASL